MVICLCHEFENCLQRGILEEKKGQTRCVRGTIVLRERGSKTLGIRIPRVSPFDTFVVVSSLSCSARTPAGPASCPSSTAATKTKNPNRNGREQEPRAQEDDGASDGRTKDEREGVAEIASGWATNRMLDARNAYLSLSFPSSLSLETDDIQRKKNRYRKEYKLIKNINFRSPFLF